MKSVKIVEVGLRDGLQNETTNLTVNQRFELLEKLIDAGIKNFELGAFVSPDWVPQMAATSRLVEKYLKSNLNNKNNSASVLVPNEKGMLQAVSNGVKEVAIFAACSETFSQKNINCSIDESFERFEVVMKLAKKNKIKVRGYLSTCFGCPFEGGISESKVVELAKKMNALGVYEISVGDTIGIAHAGQVQSVFKKLLKVIPAKKLAGHFHDTRGQALTNIFAAFNLGIHTFDASIAGLGGCPYAPGATGNVATEDVVFMFQGLNAKTNVNLQKLINIHRWLQPKMDHLLPSKVGRIGLGKL
ncbi:MAG: hydroxymethylglutaryl-CoA lyase [Pseudobdellovibrio sp.]